MQKNANNKNSRKLRNTDRYNKLKQKTYFLVNYINRIR